MPWILDKIDRLEALCERSEAQLDYLRAVRFNTPRDRRIAIEWRISYTRERLDHIRMVARAKRHDRRMAESV